MNQGNPSGVTFSILIPAYNEEDAIEGVLNDLTSEPFFYGQEIIVINDGSTDATAAIVGRFPGVMCVNHILNRGYGTSIKSGVRVATGQYICWFDADSQHQVSDLVRLCETLAEYQLEYCIGTRNGESHQDPDRKVGKWLLKTAVNMAVGKNVPDFNSGLRGFRADILREYNHLLPNRFGASTLTTLLLIQRNNIGATIPITALERKGHSTVNQLRDGLQTLRLILHIFIMFQPMKFFGIIGASFFAVGAIYGFGKALANQQGLPVLSMLLIMFGMQSFLFGFIGDQISALRIDGLSKH